MRTLECGSHGVVDWTGDACCESCGAVWVVTADDCPEFCTCGKRLLPGAPTEPFTARAICPACARDRRQPAGAAAS